LNGTAFELPTFVCVLFVGVILSNGLALPIRNWAGGSGKAARRYNG